MIHEPTNHGPVPRETLDELLNMVRARFNSDGSLASLELPGGRELNALLPLVGGRNLPHGLDDIQRQLEAAAWATLPKWRAARLAPKAEIKTKPALPPDLARFYAQPDADEGRAGLEAKVRMMKTNGLLAWCRTNQLSIEPHPTNNGLTAMRARNALYLAIKRGTKLYEP